MRRPNPALSLLVSSIAAVAQQSTAPLPEPEKLNEFFRLNSGTLIPLERLDANRVQLVQHGFMSAKGVSTTEVPGGGSSVRFRAGSLEFVVSMSMGGDPSLYSLRKSKLERTSGVITLAHSSSSLRRVGSSKIPK